jgi:hypothetical protein
MDISDGWIEVDKHEVLAPNIMLMMEGEGRCKVVSIVEQEVHEVYDLKKQEAWTWMPIMSSV